MTKIEGQLKKQIHSKPLLIEQLKMATKDETVLRPKFESLQKLEARASAALEVVQKKLAEIAAQRRKNQAKTRKTKRAPAKRKMVKSTTRSRTKKVSARRVTTSSRKKSRR
jgi:hypothetical protein